MVPKRKWLLYTGWQIQTSLSNGELYDYGTWGICCFKIYRWYLNIRSLKNKLIK